MCRKKSKNGKQCRNQADSKEDAATIPMHALSEPPQAAAATSTGTPPAAPARRDAVAEALKGNEELFSGPVSTVV